MVTSSKTVGEPKAPCVFCNLLLDRIIASSLLGLVIRDGFPVSEGHTLIIPKRHTGSFFELTGAEREDLFDLLSQARNELIKTYNPDGFNIGINDGSAAGQTVPHLHIHLIPRFKGDIKDPRGGVRWIFPDKAKYW